MNTLRRFSRRAWLLHMYLVRSVVLPARAAWDTGRGQGGVGSDSCCTGSDLDGLIVFQGGGLLA